MSFIHIVYAVDKENKAIIVLCFEKKLKIFFITYFWLLFESSKGSCYVLMHSKNFSLRP